jgi:hypothetical protein
LIKNTSSSNLDSAVDTVEEDEKTENRTENSKRQHNSALESKDITTLLRPSKVKRRSIRKKQPC